MYLYESKKKIYTQDRGIILWYHPLLYQNKWHAIYIIQSNDFLSLFYSLLAATSGVEAQEMNYIIMNSQMLSSLPSLITELIFAQNCCMQTWGVTAGLWNMSCMHHSAVFVSGELLCLSGYCLLSEKYKANSVTSIVPTSPPQIPPISISAFKRFFIFFLFIWISNFYGNFKHWII